MAGYVKLFGSILQSSIWGESSDVRVVWVTLLALADRDGIVEASVPGLAHEARVSRAVCQGALDIFLAPDPDSKTTSNDGRRIEPCEGGWRLLNYELHQDRKSAADLRSKGAERMRRYRERNASSDVTLRPVTLAVTSAQAQAQAQLAEESKPPRRAITQEIEPVTVVDRPTDVWEAGRWLTKFKIAWEAKGVVGGTPFYGDTGDTRACETLRIELERLPLALRLMVQTEAPRIFAAFFASDDRKTRSRKYPFSFFVQEFGSLRQGSAPPAGKPLPPSTVDMRR